MKSEELKGFESYEAYQELNEEFNAPWAELEYEFNAEWEEELFFC